MGLVKGLFSKKTILLGGLAVAAAAGAMKNKDKVAGLIGVRSSSPEPPYPTSSTPPAPQPATPSNYDAPGPVANTATAVPAPDPVVQPGGIDEEAEVAAAAAEAANIGGPDPEYAGRALDEKADDAFRPLAEAGEGEAEGQEQAEADLQDNAEPSAGDPIEAERQIDEVIEQQDQPFSGETVENVAPGGFDEPTDDISSTTSAQVEDSEPDDSEPTVASTAETPVSGRADETPAEEKASSVWTPPSSEQPTQDLPATRDEEEGGSEWQTWSGRAVDR